MKEGDTQAGLSIETNIYTKYKLDACRTWVAIATCDALRQYEPTLNQSLNVAHSESLYAAIYISRDAARYVTESVNHYGTQAALDTRRHSLSHMSLDRVSALYFPSVTR
jgi:hypothetical protein